MKRYHQDLPRTRSEHRRHLRWSHGWPQEPVHCICDLQAGRFRKTHALGCKNKYCKCKGYKLEPTVQDLRMREKVTLELRSFQEEMKD